MRMAGKGLHHPPGIGGVRGLGEHLAVDHHGGVCAEDGFTRIAGDGIGLVAGQTEDVILWVLAGEGAFVDRSDSDRERNPGLAQDFGAARGLGGEDQHHSSVGKTAGGKIAAKGRMLECWLPRNMERASKLIQGLRLPGDTIQTEELAIAAWSVAVGKKIAGHTRAAKLVRTRLVVEVEDKIWQRQLFALTRHIVANLAKNLGRGIVEDLEFRIVPRRRAPARAEQPVRVSLDEAENIADPVLRGIYRASRKRAQA